MTPEGAIKSTITQALKQLGFDVYRIQCGRWRVRGGGWMHGAKAGTFDLLVPVLLSGVAPAILWIDTKQPGEKLDPEQVEFARSRPKGQYVLMADSLDDVLEWLKKHEARA